MDTRGILFHSGLLAMWWLAGSSGAAAQDTTVHPFVSSIFGDNSPRSGHGWGTT